MLTIRYDISAERVLDDRQFAHDLPLMKRAGVDTLYLNTYFYGHWQSEPEEIYRAAQRLREEGICAEILHVPFGHGGNALDPDDSHIPLITGNGWRLRMDANGHPLPNTTCPNEKCIADTLAVNRTMRQMGFSMCFLDDDCRLGMWGPGLQGCFCPDCMERFGARIGRPVKREEILAGDDALQKAWMDFQCENLVAYLRGILPDGMRLGFMAMHNGDRRHGIDLPMIRKALPDTFFRVGEGHFEDASFLHPQARASLEASICTHMALAGGSENCCSESTVYPAGALSPENWIRKMEIEIDCGLRHLYLMSGTRFFDDVYWEALAEALPALRARAEQPIPVPKEKPFIWQI